MSSPTSPTSRWRSGRVKLTVTPMFGGVAGEARGLVPAPRLTLAWWKLDLSSEFNAGWTTPTWVGAVGLSF